MIYKMKKAILLKLFLIISLSAYAWRPDEFIRIVGDGACPSEYFQVPCDPLRFDCGSNPTRPDEFVQVPAGDACPAEYFAVPCDPLRFANCPTWCDRIAVAGSCPADFTVSGAAMSTVPASCRNIPNACDPTRGICEMICVPD